MLCTQLPPSFKREAQASDPIWVGEELQQWIDWNLDQSHADGRKDDGEPVVVTAREAAVGDSTVPDQPDAGEVQDTEVYSMSPRLQQLHAEGVKLYNQALAAGGSEVGVGVVAIEPYGHVHHPDAWQNFADERKVQNELASISKRVEQYQSKRRGEKIVVTAEELAGGFEVVGWRRRRETKKHKQRMYRPVWYMREGGNVAFSGAYGQEGATEITLKPNAKVLDLSDRSLKRTAALSDDAALLAKAVETQAEAIRNLTVLVEKLLAANTGGYDAIQTEDRLVVLNPAVVEEAPKRQRWLNTSGDGVVE